MLKEYALEPELLSNWRDYRFFVGQFGASNGRLISRYPKKWKKMVIEAAQRAADVEYLRIEESLKNIDSMLLARIHEWDSRQDWLSNALLEQNKRPFQAILARTSPPESGVLCGVDIGPNAPPPSWVVRKSVEIPRTAQAMANCVALLLRNCKQVLFVDPYFDPSNRRHNEPLQAFLTVIRSRDSQIPLPTLIEYHTGNKNTDVAGVAANLNRWITPSLPVRSKLTIVRWKFEELHNRYILTDRGGVMFGTGLDQDANVPPAEDTVTLLDEELCSELMISYSAASTKLTWLNDTIVVSA